jgi:hypothetical protein
MLSKEDEAKLSMFFAILENAKEHGGPPRLGFYDVKWILTKLKEVNDECSKVHEELQDANEALANEFDGPIGFNM